MSRQRIPNQEDERAWPPSRPPNRPPAVFTTRLLFRPMANIVVRPGATGDTACVSILVVGASVAEIRAAQTLRFRGLAESITMPGKGIYLPYDEPPMVKAMIGPGGEGVPTPPSSAQ